MSSVQPISLSLLPASVMRSSNGSCGSLRARSACSRSTLATGSGLYRALAEGGPATSAELASRTGTHERYIREWLEQQTVAGILEVEDENHDSEVTPLLSARRSCRAADRLRQLELYGRRWRNCWSAPSALCRPLLEAYRNGGGVSVR